MGIERSTNKDSKMFRPQNALREMTPDIYQPYLKAETSHLFINPDKRIDITQYLRFIRRGHKVHVFLSELDSATDNNENSFDIIGFVKEVRKYSRCRIMFHVPAGSERMNEYLEDVVPYIHIMMHDKHPFTCLTADGLFASGEYRRYGLMIHYIPELKVWLSVMTRLYRGKPVPCPQPGRTSWMQTDIWPISHNSEAMISVLNTQLHQRDRFTTRTEMIPTKVNYTVRDGYNPTDMR